MRSAGEVRRDEPRAARAGNSAGKVLHETRITAFAVHRPSDISFWSEPGRAHGFHETRNTKHESRLLWPFGSPWERKGRISKNHRPVTVSLRPVAWQSYCPVIAALFTIVRHCSVFFWGRRPEPLSAHRPHQQHGLLGFHETRDTQHIFPRPSGDSKESNPKPGQQVFHESRDTAFMALRCAVRRKSGAEGGGTKNRNPPPGPLRPLRSHGLPAHHWTRWDGFLVAHSGLPCRLFPTMACSLLPTIARHCPALLGKKIVPMSHSVHAPSAVLGGPQDDHRSPKLAAPSGLVLLRRTPNEPMLNMLRKGNVLY